MALANVNAPRGFTLLRTGGKTDPVRRERTATGALAMGDAYKLDANGNATRVSSGSDVVKGIVEGFVLQGLAASPSGPESIDYLASTETGSIIGIEDPTAEFVVQATTFASSDIGKNADISDSAPNAALRRSRQQVDGGSLGSGDQVKVLGLLDSPADNAFGSYAKVVVKLLQAD